MKRIIILIFCLFIGLTACDSVQDADNQDADNKDLSQATPSKSGRPSNGFPASDNEVTLIDNGRDNREIKKVEIPDDDSDLRNKKEWGSMGPFAQIIGIIEDVTIEDKTLISLDVKIQANLTGHDTLINGETIEILYYDSLPENYTPTEGEQIMTMLNHYVTDAGREIEWGGEIENLWYEKDGKAYYSDGSLYVRDGYENSLSFEEYASSLSIKIH